MQLPPALMATRSSLSRDALKSQRSKLYRIFQGTKTYFMIFQFPLATQMCEEVKEEKEMEHSVIVYRHWTILPLWYGNLWCNAPFFKNINTANRSLY